MRAGAVNLGLIPLFYDSLLCDFYVDYPEQSVHNLGHLAIETFLKKERSYEPTAGFGNIKGQQYRLRPVWAPQIESTIKCVMAGEFPTLAGISLRHTNSDMLTIVAGGSDVTEAQITRNGKISTPLALELGESLSFAASYIAQEAADIINS